jgi:hypothetical protein
MYMNTFILDVYVHIHPLICQDTRVKISSSQKLVHYQQIPGTVASGASGASGTGMAAALAAAPAPLPPPWERTAAAP